jgi:hypothetical protein
MWFVSDACDVRCDEESPQQKKGGDDERRRKSKQASEVRLSPERVDDV